MIFTRRSLCCALTAALALSHVARAAPQLDDMDTFETDRITIDSTPGPGPDVILLPGLATPGEVWDGVVADLDGRARTHVVNVKGFGHGDGAANAAGGLMAGVLSDIAAFARDHGLDRPALVGHSLGGTLALQAGIETPDLYGRLMVVDALPFVALLFDPDATKDSVEEQAASMRDQMAAAPAGANAEATAERYAIGEDAQKRVAEWIAASDPQTVAQAFYEDMQTDLRPALSDIGPPVHLIVPVPPEAEGRDLPAQYELLYGDVSNFTLHPVEDARHFVMLDQPDRMTALIEDFLKLSD
ncbi:hypothetical protein OCH239_15195 [Roseivivax halodurans JCM 10272]|uniref:AB hydrolase-1 domain-containing protein n=1 Tax=Roseivivax halodurans JCM 10272 TaxID=1449350 RepID=X7EAL1_9RHOB|nr:alpha/beta hydrolase [Roseivivax halodurans]ETX12962.1 hypothetical protein OCH239_15195 [Roseivivax halodurans JCM 10272]